MAIRCTIGYGPLTGHLVLRELAAPERRIRRSDPLHDARSASEFLATLPWDQDRENVYVLCLDARHRTTHAERISIGSLMSSVIHPREVFRPAIKEAAAGVILAHNHPSGDPTPSVEDHQVTLRLAEGGALLGIRLLDHLVIARDSGTGVVTFRSFKEEGWLPERY